jgi:pyruvate dehydrogenase E1 component
MQYLRKRREELGGYVPQRREDVRPIKTPPEDIFAEFYLGSDGRELSSTMAFVRIFTKLLKDKEIGKLIVPIIPDEARTFGMESLFRQHGIYSNCCFTIKKPRMVRFWKKVSLKPAPCRRLLLPVLPTPTTD